MLCWELCREVQCVRLLNFGDGLGWVEDSLRIYIYIVVFMQFVQAKTKPLTCKSAVPTQLESVTW